MNDEKDEEERVDEFDPDNFQDGDKESDEDESLFDTMKSFSGENENTGTEENSKADPGREEDDDEYSMPSYIEAEPDGNPSQTDGEGTDSSRLSTDIEDEDNDKTGPEKSDSQGASALTTESHPENEDKSFSKKISAEEADSQNPHKKKKSPEVLNKKILLYALGGLLSVVVLVSALVPNKGKGLFSKQKKETPREVIHKNYDNGQSPAENTGEPDNEEDRTYSSGDSGPGNESEELPPLPKMEEPQTTATTVTSGGGGTRIPDTRNDRLQGKSITGIKGLTPTQANYSTDYEKTMEQNTMQARGSEAMPSREEYMSNMLNMYTKAYGAAGGNNGYAAQNDQAGKQDFFNSGRNSATAGKGQWLGLNTIWQGTMIEGVLTTELNTDLPGDITARVARNVYSSQDGRYLLIPQNSILYGTYNSSISYSQSRVQVVWNKIIRPDGYAIDIGGMNATDAKGTSGLKGSVNDHPMAYLKAILLMSVFSGITSEFQATGDITNNKYAQNAAANAQEVTTKLGDKLIDRAMNVQPTIKIKAGEKINIIANQNLELPPVPLYPVTQKYVKW